jgi:rfaE bifunctional protein kinase chain/domain
LKDLNDIFRAFEKLKVLVIGDLMLDAYYYGKVERISPEAPVPVVSVYRKEMRLGGAANVALNIKALGATPLLTGIIGDDIGANMFTNLVNEAGISMAGIVSEKNRRTTSKSRIIGNNHQVLRVDSEDLFDISGKSLKAVKKSVSKALTDTDVIIVEDYDKGLMSKSLIRFIIEEANKADVPIVVDPKQVHFFEYKGVTLFKPNRKEIKEGLKTDADLKNLDNVEVAMGEIREKLDCKIVMTTLSEDGVMIGDAIENIHLPAYHRKIVDVSGAGDTVVSIAALCLALNLSKKQIAELSNLAGGLVCEKLGVVPINKDQLLNEALSLTSWH